MSVADRVKKAREAKGLTQKQLGELAGCTQSDVHRIESGLVNNSKYLAKILAALQIVDTPTLTLIPIVGYVGAGSEIFTIDDHIKGDGIDHIPAPPGMVNGIALIVRGNSMTPKYDDGEVLFIDKTVYSIDSLIGENCYIQLPDGRCYVKKLQYGSRPGVYTLISYNAPPIIDVAIERIYPIAFTKPRYRNLK